MIVFVVVVNVVVFVVVDNVAVADVVVVDKKLFGEVRKLPEMWIKSEDSRLSKTKQNSGWKRFATQIKKTFVSDYYSVIRANLHHLSLLQL